VVLQAIAVEDGIRLFTQDALRRYRLGSASQVERAVQRLVEREIVDAVQRGTYVVPDVFLKGWLRGL
jgi:hypothetical protein